MSGYYYIPPVPLVDEDDFDFNQTYPVQAGQVPQAFPTYGGQPLEPAIPPRSLYHGTQQFYQAPQYQHHFGHGIDPAHAAAQAFVTPTVPSNYPYEPQTIAQFPRYSEPSSIPLEVVAGPSRTSVGYLSPDEAERRRISRATSFASNASSIAESDVSRSASPNASEMARWGTKNHNGTWTCAYPGCASKSTFNRGCDLRKHYKRHTKSLFCRYDGCPQAVEGGFSSKKDRARHEAKHNPDVSCEWEGCDRLFSRVDNMVGRRGVKKITDNAN